MQNSESQKSILPIKIKVNLENMPHKVYRRILVPEDINMMQLHYVIQIAMGWEFAHHFQFSEKRNQPSIIVKIPYEDEFDDFNPFRQRSYYKPEKIKLSRKFQQELDSKPFYYWYDFGDDWWHKITFQQPTKKDLNLYAGLPVCLEAEGRCPPEDIGGPWGYANFLDIMLDKRHPEHRDYKEWAGLNKNEDYDIDDVDLDFINKSLHDYRRGTEWKMKSKDYFSD